jgi:hypothetical protein
MAKTGSVALQMQDILDDYSKDVKEATNDAIEKTSKESVRKLKNTSPKKSGEYAKGWKLKKDRGRDGIATVTVHNKIYQLTHLLENGHVVRNAKGTYGRTNGVKHIAPVEEWAESELQQEIERKL